MLAFIQANWAYIASLLWLLCELLNAIPSIKSSSVAELVINTIESLVKGAGKLPPSNPTA